MIEVTLWLLAGAALAVLVLWLIGRSRTRRALIRGDVTQLVDALDECLHRMQALGGYHVLTQCPDCTATLRSVGGGRGGTGRYPIQLRSWLCGLGHAWDDEPVLVDGRVVEVRLVRRADLDREHP